MDMIPKNISYSNKTEHICTTIDTSFSKLMKYAPPWHISDNSRLHLNMVSFYLFYSAIRYASLMWARGLHGYTIDPILTKIGNYKMSCQLHHEDLWSHTLQLWWPLETFLDCVQWPFQFHLDLGCPTGGTRVLHST